MRVEHASNVRRLLRNFVNAGEMSQAAQLAEAFAVAPEGTVGEVHFYADLLMGARLYAVASRLLDAATDAHGIAINRHKRDTAYWLAKTRAPLDQIRGGAALAWCLENLDFQSVLDIGSGGGEQAEQFALAEKKVTAIDFGTSKYYEDAHLTGAPYARCTLVQDDFNTWENEVTFDLVWASHILEHQCNVGSFLQKCWSHTADNGWLAVTVPPLKHDIVGGHLSVWNAGLVIYNLVLTGNDCSNAIVMNYDYNVSVIVPKKPIILPALDHDVGDIERLSDFFPDGFHQGFDGRMYSSRPR